MMIPFSCSALINGDLTNHECTLLLQIKKINMGKLTLLVT
jgi:hypothetical protein